MHKLFADWYRQADISVSAELLNARWGCIEGAVKELDADSILEITRVCFGLPKPEHASAADGVAIADAFKAADVSFPMKGNDHLLRVLYGVTLAQVITENHELATFAALAVTCAQCAGLGAGPVVEELLALSEQHLTTEGSKRRTASLTDPIVLPKFGKAEFIAPGAIEVADAPPNQWAPVQQNFVNLKAWTAQVNTALEALANGISKTRTDAVAAFKANAERASLEKRITVLKEESDVLWWLFGEYSASLQQPWAEIASTEFCIVIGRELAAFMAFDEPASNASSFLRKALSHSTLPPGEVTLKQLIDAGATEWRQATAGDFREAVQRTAGVTPLHAGLIERVDSASRWVERLAAITALAPDSRLKPLPWAMQAYREALLIASLERASD